MRNVLQARVSHMTTRVQEGRKENLKAVKNHLTDPTTLAKMYINYSCPDRKIRCLSIYVGFKAVSFPDFDFLPVVRCDDTDELYSQTHVLFIYFSSRNWSLQCNAAFKGFCIS